MYMLNTDASVNGDRKILKFVDLMLIGRLQAVFNNTFDVSHNFTMV